MKFLKGAIVKKSTSSSQVAESSETGVKRKHSNEEESSDGSKSAEDSKKSKNDAEDETKVGSCLPGTTLEYPTSMKCIGILPGMGSYDDSSDTDCSSCSDQDDRRGKTHFDLLGRKVVLQEKDVKSWELAHISSLNVFNILHSQHWKIVRRIANIVYNSVSKASGTVSNWEFCVLSIAWNKANRITLPDFQNIELELLDIDWTVDSTIFVFK